MKVIQMSHSMNSIKPIEKIISVASYLSMGIVGLIWFIIARILGKDLKYFLKYNITQSMVIAIILAIIKITLNIITPILWMIPIINYVASFLNLIFSVKIIRLYFVGLSFTLFELLIFILLIYICVGVLIGRIFYIPFLTKLMNRAMKS